MGKTKVPTAAVITLIALAVIGLVYVGWKAMTGSESPHPVVVKPANPSDPKYKSMSEDVQKGGV